EHPAAGTRGHHLLESTEARSMEGVVDDEKPGQARDQRGDMMRNPYNGVNPRHHRFIPPFNAFDDAAAQQAQTGYRNNVQSGYAEQRDSHERSFVQFRRAV